jgi:YD repeat-containing protein
MGNTTQILYDGMGDVSSVTLPPTAAAPAGATIHYYYDNRNRLHIRTDALTQSESWLYWPRGEVKSHTDRKGQTTTYNYDALERLSQIQYNDGTTIVPGYDTGNRVTRLTDSGNPAGNLNFAWNGLDELTQQATPTRAVNYQYDGAGRRQWMIADTQAQVNYSFDDAELIGPTPSMKRRIRPIFQRRGVSSCDSSTLSLGIVICEMS